MPGRTAPGHSRRPSHWSYTGLSERTVRTWLDRLDAAGIIGPCDLGIVAARITRTDHRPQGWDLNPGIVPMTLPRPAS